MSLSPILGITLLEASQSQPEVVVNRAIRMLEALSPLIVADQDLTAPPGSPVDGDRYIVAATATGAWATHEDAIALRAGTDWIFLTPEVGWLAYVTDEDIYVKFDGSAGWVTYP